MSAFVHPQAICESRAVGARTRIWAFAHILPGARIGADCNICDHTFIEDDVVIGDRVTVKSGVQLWDGARIEDDVFIGPNATILPGVTIGRGAMVGAGAVIVESVPPYAVVAGNPARIVSYCDAGPAGEASAPRAKTAATGKSRVKGVFVQELAEVADLRGGLVAGEIGKFLPFAVKRFFVVHGVSSRQVRGQHAHRTCHQFLVCVRGSCRVIADDGKHRQEFLLDRGSLGVYLPPKTWGVQYDYSADAALLVFASHAYDPDDYVRDYDEFRKLVRR